MDYSRYYNDHRVIVSEELKEKTCYIFLWDVKIMVKMIELELLVKDEIVFTYIRLPDDFDM